MTEQEHSAKRPNEHAKSENRNNRHSVNMIGVRNRRDCRRRQADLRRCVCQGRNRISQTSNWMYLSL